MRRKIITSLFIIFLFLSLLKFYNKDEDIIPVFNETKKYDLYTITYQDGLRFSNYQKLFQDLSVKDYRIISFKLVNNYRDSINYQINKITLNKEGYLYALDEYLKNYKNILYEYDLYSDIDKINRNDFIIKEITIYSTYPIYQKMTVNNT